MVIPRRAPRAATARRARPAASRWSSSWYASIPACVRPDSTGTGCGEWQWIGQDGVHGIERAERRADDRGFRGAGGAVDEPVVTAVPVDRTVLEQLVGGTFHDPHQVLGPHLGEHGVTVRVLRPFAQTVTVLYDDQRLDAAARVRGCLGRRSRHRQGAGLPARGELHRRPRGRARRPVPLPPVARRGRPAPDRRGPPRAAVDRARRPRPPVRRPGRSGHRDVVRRLGAERARHPADRGLQLLGRPRASDALAGLVRGLGDVRARRRPGDAVQVRHLRPGRRLAAEGRPDGQPGRDSPGERVRRARVVVRVGRRGLAGAARRRGGLRRADERLRGAPRVVAEGQVVPRAGRRARCLCQRHGLHPRRADAGDGASVRRLVGLPGDVVLRADVALRRSGRLPAAGRPAAPGRHRRDRRLGAGALPEGRLGAGALRRDAAVRAPGPAPRRAAGLGHAGVRLRPAAGAQLPGRERALLGRGVPHRRPAGGRGRLDALPGLLARKRASGCRTSTAAGRTWRPCRSCRR